MQPFGAEIVAMVDRQARTTAVAFNDFLAGAREGQVPRADSTGRCNTLIAAWVNFDGTAKPVILAQVGHYYFGAVGQYYLGANNQTPAEMFSHSVALTG